jgi:hypothetical protein
MKRILYLGLLFLMGCSYINHKILVSKKEFLGNALLVPKHTPVPIYNFYKGNVIGYAINDTVTESYAIITIADIKNSFAKVVIDYPLENNRQQKGWIKTKHLGIHLTFGAEPINVMSQPNSSAKIAFTIDNPQWGDFYPIIDAYDGWLYIQNINNPKEFGWLAPEFQCDNPYTVCC